MLDLQFTHGVMQQVLTRILHLISMDKRYPQGGRDTRPVPGLETCVHEYDDDYYYYLEGPACSG
jgi:hypothetical protein